jgi:hypothetical protein
MKTTLTPSYEPFLPLENFSNDLDSLAHHLDESRRSLEDKVRADLLNACQSFHRCRYDVGRAIAPYRAIYVGRCWLQFASAVAKALGCSERTIRGYVARYERLSHLDEQVARSLIRRKEDNDDRLLEALEGIEASNPEEADAVIEEREKSLKQIADEEGEDEAPTPITPEEKAFARLNDSLGHRLDRIAPPRRLEMIERAVAAQLWAAGVRDEITITIRPRPANATLPVRKKCCNREPEILLSDRLRA